MNEQKNNGRGIFYGVIGVATLVIAIIGATFAYFTATATAGNNVITGNMATITFNLDVEKVSTADELKGGMIPMSNNMVERAFDKGTVGGAANLKVGDEICTDDTGNAVCQVYKITVENTGSASLFLDGYVTLTDDVSKYTIEENGQPKEVVANVPDYDGKTTKVGTNSDKDLQNYTSMRWAQAFCTEYTDAEAGEGIEAGDLKTCTTSGMTTTRSAVAEVDETPVTDGVGITKAWNPILNTGTDAAAKLNTAQIKRYQTATVNTGEAGIISVAQNGDIAGSYYDIIDKNFIRLSDHTPDTQGYDRYRDVTSALVFNQPLNAKNDIADNNGDSFDSNFATDNSQSYTDAQVYYIVVWLTETGVNQTQSSGSTEWNADAGNPDTYHFFNGSSTFVSAQGSEVTATFSGYSRVARTD